MARRPLRRSGKSESESVPIARRVFGRESREALTTTSNWAGDLNRLDHFAEAEKLDREILDIRRRVLGPQHPDTLNSMNNLAGVLTNEGHYVEAEKLNRETLDTRRRVLGSEHPETLGLMSDLALFCPAKIATLKPRSWIKRHSASGVGCWGRSILPH